MEDLTHRISYALALEEVRAERFASNARLILLGIFTIIAFSNASTLTFAANAMNFGGLAVCYTYGLIVSLQIKRKRYRPFMKYLTSCIDVFLVMLVLALYTTIESPAVALKNYVFLVVFPLIGLTALRYDAKLTLTAGATALVCYVSLSAYLILSHKVDVHATGYSDELFTQKVSLIAQSTKILILIAYIALVAYLARYSRRLMERLVRQEIEIQSEKETIEHELEVAAHVQRELLPHSFPQVGTLEVFGKVAPGRFVGGDYCDFIKTSNDRLLMIVADVSGKGVPAALIMSEVRASTHLLASMNTSLADFVERLNTLLHQSTERKTFVTLFVGEIDTSQSEIRYINAGHPRPLICRDGQMSTLGKGTIPLGVMTEIPQCTVQKEPFPRGSLLVGYTDGILERRDMQGEEYGEERLRSSVQLHRSLDAQALVESLLADVRAFGGGSELDDDITVAVVKWG
jgi:serine phosphatase RsbU (regulator of sigma subunit)